MSDVTNKTLHDKYLIRYSAFAMKRIRGEVQHICVLPACERIEKGVEGLLPWLFSIKHLHGKNKRVAGIKKTFQLRIYSAANQPQQRSCNMVPGEPNQT